MSNPLSRIKIQDIFDRDPNKFEPHPHRAWAIIFSVGFVVSILIVVAHLYVYLYMRTDSSFKPDDSSLVTSEVKLNRSGLTEVTNMLEAKNAQFQDLLVSPPKISDPSFGAGHPQLLPAPASPSTITPQKKAPLKTTNTPTPV